MSKPDFLNLNLVCDVFLDTFGWSGGHTTIDALSCDLPVVTCPGEFLRGRHGYGILKMLGVTDTVAQTEEEYIEIATKLILEPDWKQELVTKIRNNIERLYEDKTCVKGLHDFYEEAIKTHQIN